MLTAGYNVMGYKSYEWGRYFYIAAVISQGNLHSSSENAFFHENSMRLLPITSVADQGPHVSGSYKEGLKNNLQAVVAAFPFLSAWPETPAVALHPSRARPDQVDSDDHANLADATLP